MLKSVNVLEYSAAQHWKFEINESENWMISDSKRVTSRPNSPEGEFLNNGSGKNYVCKGTASSNDENPAVNPVVIEWPEEGNWTMSDLNSAKKEIEPKLTDSHNSKKWFEILTRCETKDEITRVLLKPEWSNKQNEEE